MTDEKTTPKTTGETPLYLRISNYSITNSLHAKLTLFPVKTQEKMAFIQSMVICFSRKAKHPALFVNVHSKVFKRCRGYGSVMTLLVSLGELEVNQSYKAGRNTMSYRIPQSKLASGTTTFSAKIKRVRAVKDKTTPLTGSIVHQRNCFQKLTVRDVFISTGDSVRDEIARRELLNVRFGAANIRKGKRVNRETNTVLAIPRDARSNLAHKDGIPLCEYDFKSCHPFLLLAYCKDDERVKYQSLICNPAIDIYNYVAEQSGVNVGAMGASEGEEFRAKMKLGLLRYLNGGKNKMFESFYAKHFPNLNCFIKSGGKGNAKMLQDFESSIMEELGNWCADTGKFYLQQHDGYLSTSSDGACIAQRLEDIVFERLGARPVVKAKELRSSEEITNTPKNTSTNNKDITNTTNNTTDTTKDKTTTDVVYHWGSYVAHKNAQASPQSYVAHKEPCPEIVHYQDTYTMEDELAASLSLF